MDEHFPATIICQYCDNSVGLDRKLKMVDFVSFRILISVTVMIALKKKNGMD